VAQIDGEDGQDLWASHSPQYVAASHLVIDLDASHRRSVVRDLSYERMVFPSTYILRHMHAYESWDVERVVLSRRPVLVLAS
jgi:hypothetical protein